MALNKKGEIVRASAYLCKEASFYCPSCKGRVYLKIGQIVRPHFAHYHKVACQVFSEGETAEHLEGKLQLATYLKMTEKNVQLEAYLPELQQRPDILFERDGRKMVIEFQCSPITVEKVIERTQGYFQKNYEVLWILGNQFNGVEVLTAFHKACLYLSSDNEQPVLVHYDAGTDCLFVRSDFQQLSNGRVSYQLKQRCLNEQQPLEYTQGKKSRVDQNRFQDIERKHRQFMRAVRYPNPKIQAFLEVIYLNQESFVSIPKELYWTIPSEWLIQTHPMNWKYQFIIWLESFPIKKILTKKLLKNWINHQLQVKKLVYYRSPQLTEELQLQPFIEWLAFLVKQKTVKKIGHLKWSYRKPLKRYTNLEEKLKENIQDNSGY